MMRAMWHLTLRSCGFELAAFAIITFLLVGAMAVFAALLLEAAPSGECAASGPVGQCASARGFFRTSATANQIIVLSALFPLLLGAVLGSQLFSRDIERGSMQLPWSMCPSRLRWFAERVLITGACVVVLTTCVAIATNVLEAAIHPDVSPWATFLDFGFRGPSVMARGLSAFVLASVIGLILARPFPALLSGLVVAAIVAVISQPLAIATQPSTVVAEMGTPQVGYAIVRDDLYEAGDGRLLTQNEVTSLVPPGTEDPFAWIQTHFTEVAVGIPGDRYPVVEAVASGLLLAVSVLALAVGVIVVRRRRPY